MSSTPKSASEKTFQENFVRELEKYKWKALEELNEIMERMRKQSK